MGAGGVSHLAMGLSMSRALSLRAPLYLRDILLGDLYLYIDYGSCVHRTYHIPCQEYGKTSALWPDMATQSLISTLVIMMMMIIIIIYFF